MFKKLADRILRAPAAADGGTAVADPHDSDPSALSSWMTDLPQIETNSPLQPASPAPPPKKEPDGKSAEKSDGTGGAGVPGGVKPAEHSDKNAADAPAGKSVADDAAKPDAKPDAKPEGVEGKGKEKEAESDTAEAVRAELEKENWPRSGSQWNDYKKKYSEKFEKAEKKSLAEIQAREERIKSLETELGTVREASAKADEPAPEVKAQIEKLSKENEEYSRRLQVLDVTQHPKFQAYFAAKENAQKEMAKSIVGADRAKVLEEIISLPSGEYRNQRMEEFIADLGVLQQNRIGGVLNNLDAIEQERQSEIAKSKEHTSTLTAQQQEKAKASNAAREKLVNTTVVALQANMPAFFAKKAGDAAQNKAVEERLARGKALLTGEGVEQADIVKAAFHAAAFPGLLQSYQKALQDHAAQAEKFEAQIKALSAAQPSAGASVDGAPGGQAQNPQIKLGQTPQEASAAWTKGLWQDQ